MKGLPKWLVDVLRALVVALLGALADGAVLGQRVSDAAVVAVYGRSHAPGVVVAPVAKP